MTSRQSSKYAIPIGGLPAQDSLLSPTDKAVVTNAYTFIPAGVHRDIVTMHLPHWTNTRIWVLAKPVQGFATTFSQYMVEVSQGGGSSNPDPDSGIEHALFITRGNADVSVDGQNSTLAAGDFIYIPNGCSWTLQNSGKDKLHFHWFRKRYEQVDGIGLPESFTLNENELDPIPMPDTDGKWTTTRFFDPDDVRYDMHITIVTLLPGAVIPFMETHVMEHGLYVLEGKGVYRLNQDWIEVEAGDYMCLRAFCPQACYAGGAEPFRYLLYKDMHRHSQLP